MVLVVVDIWIEIYRCNLFQALQLLVGAFLYCVHACKYHKTLGTRRYNDSLSLSLSTFSLPVSLYPSLSLPVSLHLFLSPVSLHISLSPSPSLLFLNSERSPSCRRGVGERVRTRRHRPHREERRASQTSMTGKFGRWLGRCTNFKPYKIRNDRQTLLAYDMYKIIVCLVLTFYHFRQVLPCGSRRGRGSHRWARGFGVR